MSYKDSEESSHQYRAANELSSEIDADDYAVPALEIGSIVALPFLTERQVALATAATNSPFPPQLYVEEVILPRLSEVQQNGKTKLQNELAKPPYERRYFDADSYAAFYLNGVIKKSFGKAHGSVGDKAKIEFWLQDVPRLATLLMARAGRGQDLLQATSRGLPFYGMHVPKLIKKSEVYSAVQKTENEIWKIYWKFLQDWEKPQFAMHHMPLFAMTNITDTFSGRAVVEYFLASTGGYSPEAHDAAVKEKKEIPRAHVLRELAWKLLVAARQHYPNLLKDYVTGGHSKNFEPLRVYQGGSSDFLEEKNEPLEQLIKKEELAGLRSGSASIAILGAQGEDLISKEGIENAIRTRDTAYLAFLETALRYQTAMRIPISEYHDWWRHRTVIRNHRPFKKILDDVIAAEAGGHDFSGLYACPPFQKEKNNAPYDEAMAKQLSLCVKLQNEGTPWYETIGFLPHAMLNYEVQSVGGWNLLYLAADRMCISARPGIQKTMNELKEQLQKRKSPVAELMHPHGYFSPCTIADEWGCSRYCRAVALPATKGIPMPASVAVD